LVRVSVALHVTVVVPKPKVVPEAGEQVALTTPSMLSIADDENVTAAPACDVASATMFRGTVTTGAVVSTSATLTAKLALPMFPLVSAAVHVTVVVPTANGEPLAGLQLGVIAPSTLSVAVAANIPIATPPSTFVVRFRGPGTTTIGAVSSISVTVTGSVAPPVLPEASVEEHETIVVPTPNWDPDAGEHVIAGAASTSSLTVAVYVTASPAGSFVLTFEGPLMLTVGEVVSLTVTRKLPALEFVPSLALQFTVVVPRTNVEPDAGVQFTEGDPATASAAEAEKATTAPSAPAAGCTMFPGSVSTGP
jgi:hypothetical protein